MADSNVATPEVDTTPPWEMAWNTVKKAVADTTDNVSNALNIDTQSLAPWQMNWGSKRQANADDTQPSPQQPPQEAPDRFSTVFNKLIGVESTGQHLDASGGLLTSSAGAQGISQVMPATGASPGYGVTPIQNKSPQEYLRFGSDYLKAMLNNFGGDYEKATAAYNAGPKAVENAVAKAQKTGGDWKLYIPAETRKYVRNILG